MTNFALKKGPVFSLPTKGGPKKQSPRSCSFLSKEPPSKEPDDMNELYSWIFNLNIYSLNQWIFECFC